MKKFLLSIMAMALLLQAHAAVVTFNFTANEFNLPTTSTNTTHDGDLTAPIVKDGITMSYDKGTSQYGPLMWYSAYNSLTDLRFYTGSSFTVSSTSGATITSIAFTYTKGKLSVTATPEGSWTGDSYDIWTGSAAEVVFAVTGGTQLQTMTVTTSDNESSCAVPVISPAFTELYSATPVSIACSTEGASIYYTVNGDEPTAASTPYVAPFSITAATTVKAIAVSGTATSAVATADFTFPVFTAVDDIAGFLRNADADNVSKIGTDLTVTYQYKKYLFVKDASGYLQVYGDISQTLAPGDIIAGGMVGTFHSQNGSWQLLPVVTTIAKADASASVTPVTAATSDFNESFQNTFATCKAVQLTRVKNGNSYDYSITDSHGTLPLYNRFDITMPADEGTYDATGIASYYNGTAQLYPITLTSTSAIEGVNSDAVPVVATNRAINILGNAATIEVYTAGGALVSKNEATVNCAAGLYIVKVDGKATKVVVK